MQNVVALTTRLEETSDLNRTPGRASNAREAP
jgi:hypothetical protein